MDIVNDAQKSHKLYAAIVSRPSCVSLANKLGISIDEAFERIRSALYSYGVSVVVRKDLGEVIAMLESITEFDRRRHSTSSPSSISQDPSYAIDSTRSVYPKEGQLFSSLDIEHLSSSNDHYTLLSNNSYFQNESSHPSITPNHPFITSNCPG